PAGTAGGYLPSEYRRLSVGPTRVRISLFLIAAARLVLTAYPLNTAAPRVAPLAVPGSTKNLLSLGVTPCVKSFGVLRSGATGYVVDLVSRNKFPVNALGIWILLDS